MKIKTLFAGLSLIAMAAMYSGCTNPQQKTETPAVAPTGIDRTVAILAGILILFSAFRSWRKPAKAAVAGQSAQATHDAVGAAQDEYEKRLEEELSNR